MGTEGDENERDQFGPPVGDFGPPLDDEGFGGPVAATPPPAPPGALPELGWRPAGPGSPAAPGAPAAPGSPTAPGPFGAPVTGAPPSAPESGPFGAPVAGQPPVAPPPGPPTMPPRPPVPPRLPADRRSAETAVFGTGADSSPFGAPTSPPDAPFGAPPQGASPSGASPFGEPTSLPAAAPFGGPASAPETTRFGAPTSSPDASPFGAPTPSDDSPFGAPTGPPPDATVRIGGKATPRAESPFGEPVNADIERTEVIRRERPGPRAEAPAPETVRAPLAEEPKSEDKAWWNSPDEGGAVPKPPAEPGLSWADDPIARRLAPKTPPPAQEAAKKPDKRLVWLIGGGVAAVLLVVALVLTIGLVKRGGGDPGVTAAPVPSGSATECQAVAEAAVTVGNGPGDTSTGAKAILGFQYAFYVERSGTKVREFAAPDGDISPAETIQAAIDEQIPVGATHCVKMRETGEGRYDVELREWHPDGTAIVYKQEIITTSTDGKWQIHTIAAR